MIQLERLGKTFQSARPGAAPVAALHDVSLEVPRGAVWAVVGPNGAGKTTLFSLLLGFLHPDTGAATVDGLAPREYARRHGFAYLPERFDLPSGWNVRAALRAFASLEGLASSDARHAVEREIERYGLGSHAAASAGTLSRGLMQRAGLAQACLGQREVVVLDEPTQGLDPVWRIRLRDRVREFRGEGRTVLLASHDLDEVQRLADRVVLLERGGVRRIIDLEAERAAALRYRLDVSAGEEHVASAFPDARRTHGTAVSGEPTTFDVVVDDLADLNRRLAALIELGGTIGAVRPLGADLEREFEDS